ncbi:ABC transporter permease [Clostridiales bacterium PH28_bin88]|nr:ABC transporter permease [Clostridiales bacterium PH28_bin88]
MHINYWQTFRQDGLGRAGLGLLALVVGLALFAPLLAAHEPAEYAGPPLAPPSREHWLGTNDVGQDVWSRLLYGARTSLVVGGGVAALAGAFSLIIGSSTALLGGLYDRCWMRAVDVMLVIPPVIVVMLAAAYLRPNLGLLVVLLSILIWPGGARIIRAQTLSLQARMPVVAARAYGAGRWHLLTRHILPDLGPILVAVMIQDARRAVFMEAGLSFLGVADPSLLSWGKMMQRAMAFTYLDTWKWWLVPTGLALSVTVMGLSFVGSALEAVLDPRLRAARPKDGKAKT